MSTSSRLSSATLVASLMLGCPSSVEAAPLFIPPAATAASANIIAVEGAGAGPNEAASAPQFDRRGRLVPESQQGRDRGRILGGARGGLPAIAPASDPHIDWCLSRYRSYNPDDNTFQPYRGPRVYCRSPYG